jgi:hypothetical protein
MRALTLGETVPGPGALKDSRPFPCDKLSLEKGRTELN